MTLNLTHDEAKAILAKDAREKRLMDRRGLSVLAHRARARRDAQLAVAAEIAQRMLTVNSLDPGAHYPDAIGKEYSDALARAKHHAEDLARIESVAEEKRTGSVIARIREPRTYEPGSPHSFYADHALAATPNNPYARDAAARLHRHAVEVAFEARNLTVEGRRANLIADTRSREGASVRARDEERRALSSASGSGGAFVTPQYLESDFSLYRGYPPSFWKQSTPVSDMGYGLEMLLPSFTSPATVGQQLAENEGIDDTSPTGVYLSAALVTMAGEVPLSQQLLDRAGPGLSFDQAVHDQLREQLNAAVDGYFLTQAIAGAGTLTDSSAFSVANTWGDLASAGSKMLTQAGTVLPPTHLFMQPALYQYLTAQVDATTNRPILTPQPAGAAYATRPGPDGMPAPGATGERILSLPAFTDGSIPNSAGGYSQLLVCSMADVHTLCTEPTFRIELDTQAEHLTPVAQLYAYAGIIVRHSAAVQVVTGSAYSASPSFA